MAGYSAKIMLVSDVYFETLTSITSPQLRADMLEMWQRNTELGAAIGVRPGDPSSRYAELLAGHEQDMADGRGWLYVMRDSSTQQLLGFAWWIVGIPEGQPQHIATIKRLQVSPDFHGRGLGRMLMEYLHSVEVLASLGADIEFLHLQFRAGLGLGKLYARYGYELNVRWDVIRRNDDGSHDGWMEMIRRRDGKPMPEPRW